MICLVNLTVFGAYANKPDGAPDNSSSPPVTEKKSNIGIPACIDLHGQGLRICSAVETATDADHGGQCTPESCRAACCMAAHRCQQANYLSHSTFECIEKNLLHHQGTCCTVTRSKGVTKAYASGIIGALIMCGGLYFLVSTGSKNDVIKGEKPDSDEETEDNALIYETKTPHLKVDKLLATDADDVFWED
ncbi:hypothetical protein BdWA1_000902 [Babesia duncani]|uniref:Uncharacterized protein n=1 Tax=Babesia duncani TaxID=323732 RepID=A0AAD9PH87_9APIC|nr:hypothetical protein BdWA1_003722 [Babesia duncani]KAK2197899.1 hypothetical protein BdWA1_000902 [Babesia duncani]